MGENEEKEEEKEEDTIKPEEFQNLMTKHVFSDGDEYESFFVKGLDGSNVKVDNYDIEMGPAKY